MSKYYSLLLIISLLVFSACGADGENSENGENSDRARTIVVETTIVESSEYSDFIRLTGSMEAVEDAMVSAQASGRVLSIVERGTRVNRGDIIAELDDELVRASYNVAKANYNLLVDVFNRQQPLHADSIVSTLEFNQIVTQKEQAEAQLNQAKRQLEDTRIKAPFSGRVEERMVREGELLNPGMPVVRLVNNNRLRIRAGIPERYALDIREGTPVTINLASYGAGEMDAAVSFIGAIIDPNSRTLPVEIEFPNRDGNLKPEMIVTMDITRLVLDDVITVPRTALIRGEEGMGIFVAREENGHKVARLVDIKIGESSGNRVIVTEGLSDKDEVVIIGQTNLNEGDRLNITRTHNFSGRNISQTSQIAR